jgi:hypothetical protein
VVTYLGSPLSAGRKDLAFFFGVGGLLLLIVTTRYVLRNKVQPKDQICPFLCLGAYSVGSALVTGIARSPFGSQQALASRYTTVSLLFWIMLMVLLFVILKSVEIGSTLRHGSWRTKVTVSVLIGVIAVAAAAGSIGSYDHARKWRERLTSAREELFRLENDDLLARLYPRPHALRIAVKTLSRHNLSVFREADSSREPTWPRTEE